MWLYFAVLSAFLNSLGILARRTHGSLARPVELSWWSLLLSLPFGILLVMFESDYLWRDNRFILPLLLSTALNTCAGILTFRAYQHAEASAITPITNLLPAALLVTTIMMFGVLPTVTGVVGVFLVVAGVYYSSVHGKHTITYPLKQLLKNKGSRAMLMVVGLWSVSTNLEKIALSHASPAFLLLAHQLLQFAVISLYLVARPPKHRLQRGEQVFHRWGKHLAVISLATTGSVFFQYKAISLLANTSYVLAIKRLDILFVIILAAIFYKEHDGLRRFTGAVVALAGVALIVIFN